MRLIEIFHSIEGEGIRAGMPVTFIRLAGCNLRCSYCDTKYSYNEEAENAEVVTPQEIIERVHEFGCNNITITGGEPLIHEDIEFLIDELLNKGFRVNVETNGTRPLYRAYNPDIIYTVDYKCPSSGMEDKMCMKAIVNADVLKFVVGSEEDLQSTLSIIPRSRAKHIFYSPVYGKIELETIVKFMLTHKLHNCRLQVQLHKLVWDPDMRGV